jgi:hypothetical protein
VPSPVPPGVISGRSQLVEESSDGGAQARQRRFGDPPDAIALDRSIAVDQDIAEDHIDPPLSRHSAKSKSS